MLQEDSLHRLLAVAAAAWMLLGATPGGATSPPTSPAVDPSIGAAAEPSVAIPFVTTRGKQFVAGGRTLLLKGINLGNWLVPEGYMFDFATAKSPRAIYAATVRALGPEASIAFWRQFRENFVSQADIQFIARAGFNTVRVPLHYAMFVTDGKRPAEGYVLLDRLITWCKAAGLYVVLDMHAAPGGQTGINHDDGPGYPLLFYVPAHQDLTVMVWRKIAEHYKDEPTVLGYDLLNEPIAPYHDMAHLNPKLETLYRRLVTAIRQVDTRHVIFLGGAQWNTNFAVFGPPFDGNIAYTYHKFWSYTTRAAVQEYLNFSNRYDVPLWLGESGEASDDSIEAFRKLHERYAISWCFWTYKNMTSSAAVVSIARPRHWDEVVAFADQRQTAAGGARADQPRPTVAAALGEYLQSIRLEHCRINHGYLQALGLSSADN